MWMDGKRRSREMLVVTIMKIKMRREKMGNHFWIEKVYHLELLMVINELVMY